MRTRYQRLINRQISMFKHCSRIYDEIPFFRWYFVIFSSFFLLLLVKFDNEVEFRPSIQPEHCANRLCHALIQFIRCSHLRTTYKQATDIYKDMNLTFVAIISSLIFLPALSLSWSNSLISNSYLVLHMFWRNDSMLQIIVKPIHLIFFAL